MTCYHHKDANNEWLIQKLVGTAEPEDVTSVKHGDVVRLVHEQTKRHLHSHSIKAPVTNSQWEVSGYGNNETQDPNDAWVVEVASEQSSHPQNGVLRSLTTNFRLRHRQLGCLLSAENVNLPQWGFRQIEVTCDQRNRTNSPFSTWNIEQHWNDKCK